MKYYLGVTDTNWFDYLKGISPEDVNFWQPGGKTVFRILDQGAPFLFKLKSPYNVVGGIGFFSSHSFLSISMCWKAFGIRNGCSSLMEFQQLIAKYRRDHTIIDPVVGCIVLTNPIFFRESDWIELPLDWKMSIVQGKSYDSGVGAGKELWEKIESILPKYLAQSNKDAMSEQLEVKENGDSAFAYYLTKIRVGQGAFRVLVTDTYSRRCAISGEKTLPVLEAAHIKPYSESGPHLVQNGLLLRSDIHQLFDSGYVTVTPDLRVEVSKRIQEEFSNGKEYYRFHGNELQVLPSLTHRYPNDTFLRYHNEKVFR